LNWSILPDFDLFSGIWTFACSIFWKIQDWMWFKNFNLKFHFPIYLYWNGHFRKGLGQETFLDFSNWMQHSIQFLSQFMSSLEISRKDDSIKHFEKVRVL
jgi:hypothetical protein